MNVKGKVEYQRKSILRFKSQHKAQEQGQIRVWSCKNANKRNLGVPFEKAVNM